MPQVYDAIAVVGERLLADGQYLAARGHLMLLLDLSGHKDERATSLVMNLDGSPQLPLLMKEAQPLESAPDGALWKSAFDQAMEFTHRAQWIESANKLQELARTAGDWPQIWRNIATLRLWLADNAAGMVALRKYARQPLGSSAAPPLDDMVEAEALAQMIDAEGADYVDVLTITYPITNYEQAFARLSSDPRAVRLPIDLARLATEDQPPPKAAMWILDRKPPETGKGITRDQAPRVVGQAFLYGRETDREARLELLTYRTEELKDAQRVLGEIAGDALGSDAKEEVTSRTPAISHALSWNWRLPDDTPADERAALISAERRMALLEKWPSMNLKVLDGRSPNDVSKDPAMRVRLLAAVLILELSSMNDGEGLDFNELRSQLGLPVAGKIDPATNDVRLLPLSRLHRVDVPKLTDEQLATAYARAAHYRHVTAIRLFSEEILKRPSLEKEIPRSEVFGQLAQIERDPRKAITYIDQARTAAEAAGQSSAPWDITEMTMRLSMGDFPEADRLLQHIRNEHIREPGVAQLLFQVLVEAGVIRPDGTPTAAPPTAAGAAGMMQPGLAPAAPAEAGKIWTPGAEAAPAGAKKSVIWTPE